METHLQFDRATAYNSISLPNSTGISLQMEKWVGKKGKMNAFKELFMKEIVGWIWQVDAIITYSCDMHWKRPCEWFSLNAPSNLHAY